MNRRTAVGWGLALLILAINLILNRFFFLPGETNYRDSIEAGYASMAHFLSQNPNPWGWNPLQYCGLPTNMWYLPVVPYMGALGIKLFPTPDPGDIHRSIVTAAACLLPVLVYILAWRFSRRRIWALWTALAYTVMSPAYLIYPAIDSDRGWTYLPWRMQLLVKYGEGPHTLGLALAVLALLACWRAATGRQFRDIFLAAVLLALVTLTNWVAALACGWCVLMMLVAGMTGAAETGFLARRVLAAAGLGYLLAGFWLTPGFVRTTLLNWPVDSFGFRLRVLTIMALAALSLLTGAVWLLFRRRAGDGYFLWVSLCFTGFFLVASIYYWFGVDTIPESRRYAMEAELFFFLWLFECLRRLAASSRWWVRDAVMVGTGAIFAYGSTQAWPYAVNTWVLKPLKKEATPEYRVSEFIHRQRPEGRAFVSGGTRFRLNSWFLTPQLGGTFESGLNNRTPLDVIYHVRTGLGSAPENRVRDSVWLLRASGVEYFAIHGEGSREHWRDILHPERFEQELQPEWKDGADAVYRLPFSGLAHLVRPDEPVPRRPIGYDVDLVERYVKAMDDPTRPRLKTEWEGPSRIRIRGVVPAGMWVSLMVSHDRGWRARQGGVPLEVAPDGMDLILLRPQAAGQSEIVLEYVPSAQTLGMTALSGLAWLAGLIALVRERRRSRV